MTFGRAFLVAAILAVAVGLIAGFTDIGSPAHTRLVALDTQRRDDLDKIGAALRVRYGEPGRVAPARLPPGIGGLRSDGSATANDPVTDQPYEYIRVDDTHVRLCASFALKSDPRDNPQDSVKHAAGRTCLPYDIRQSSN